MPTGYVLDNRGVVVPVPVGSRIFSSPIVQIDFGVNPASYPMVTGGFFSGGKAARA
jgi:hypothetical protein